MTNHKPGLGTQLRRLVELLDGDLEALYARDLPGYRPRFTPVMRALSGADALTVNEIARASGVSQPAASQTIGLMVAGGWVRSRQAASRREREVSLTDKGRAALPSLERQWALTHRAAARLEGELGTDLGEAVARAIRALEARSFTDRIGDEAAAS